MTTLERAVEAAHGSHSVMDIEQGIADGRYQRWEGEESVIITEIVQVPAYKVLRFFLAAGNLKEIEAMAPGIMFWGKRHGCEKAELIGRFGWQRSFAAKKLGAKPTAVVMECELT